MLNLEEHDWHDFDLVITSFWLLKLEEEEEAAAAVDVDMFLFMWEAV
jgi:hypothetical protein